MKQIKFVVLGLVMLLLTACSSADTTNESQGSDKNDEEVAGSESTDNEKVDVDKGLLNVEITLPASFFEDDDIDEVIADAKEDGVAEVTQNEDGSLTYKMSKAKHKEMMAEMEKGLLEYVDELKNDEEFSSIKDVTYHKSFSEFTIVVEREAYENSFDGFAILGLGMTGMYYQLFDGVNSDKNKVTIHLKDESTGEVFDSVVYPDDLDE